MELAMGTLRHLLPTTIQLRSDSIHPHIVLYTNHGCPFAHRAHIVWTTLPLKVNNE